MNRIFCSSFAALIGGALVAAPYAGAQDVVTLTGSANQVGKVLPRAGQVGGSQVSLSGRFTFGGTIDLCMAAATITNLLRDLDLGELVTGTDGADFLPVTLAPSSCVDKAISVTKSSARPSARLVVVQRIAGVYDFNLKIKRATIAVPPKACSDGAESALLDFGIVLDDGVNHPLTVEATATWRCQRSQLHTKFGVPVPTPTPIPPPTPTPTPIGALTPEPTPTPNIGEVIDLTGHATRLDEAGAPSSTAQILLAGHFCAAPVVDLTTVAVSLDQILDEADGAGELVGGIPIALEPVAGGLATKQQYRTVGPGPSAWMQLQEKDPCTLPGGGAGTRYELNVKVDQSQDTRNVPITYLRAPACENGGSTSLTTSFFVGGTARIEVTTTLDWLCSGVGAQVSEISTP